jgi:hypothetical protein
MDKGPWSVASTQGSFARIESDDFRRDVTLIVSGDFADDAERLAYCEWLAGVLNKAADQE